MKLTALISLLTLMLIGSQQLFKRALATTSTDISLEVGVNICGNSLVESPAEDCEGTDLNGQSCQSQGYGGGLLSCDSACTFITSSCTSPSPSPSASVSPSPSTNPTPASSSNPSLNQLATPSPTPTAPTPAITTLLRRLPTPLLNLLDQTSSTLSLTTTNLTTVLTNWVASWRATPYASLSHPTTNSPSENIVAQCDINEDESCNITDLSVILFYVNR